MLASAKWRARRDGVPFDLTLDDVRVPKRCPYLGIPIFVGDGRPVDNSPSLDRLDPELGYVRGNVIVVSFRANQIKSDASPDELERIALAVRRLLTKSKAA